MSFRFGEWRLASDRRQLLRGGEPVELTPKAYQLLELLLERRPGAVSKAEIHDRLWPDTFVSEANLPALVFEVRNILEDDARRPRWLRTVRGFGYAFCGEAVEEAESRPRPAGPVHVLYLGGRALPLHEGDNVLGRGAGAEVFVDSEAVSRRHALVRVSGEKAVLQDLDSKNGTFLRGRRIRGPAPLADGDEIRLGSVRLGYRAMGEEATRTVAGE